MSWIAEYDTRGREFPTCVHVTKTTDFMTHGATYVPIEDGKAVRDENARLREVVADGELHAREILAENAKLRKLVDGLRYCANESHGHGRCSVRFVDGYVTYCPLYDVDSDTARCEALLRELGVEVPE